MTQRYNPLDTLDEMITYAVSRGIGHLTAEDGGFDGRLVTAHDRPMVNFGSCSYLGLEVDERLKQGAIEATRRWGTQFSTSRAYISAPPYQELEERLGEILGASALLAPTTTLAHLAALPVLIGADDAVILDQQVHNSVQMASNQLKARGQRVELIRHNDVAMLEARLEALAPHHRHVWYLADGIYSMHGDLAPMDALVRLLERHEQLHFYFDDAHGMAWTGRHGRGYVLDHTPIRERMVVATSLAKAFGVGGGVLAFANPEQRRRVRTCGGPFIFSGPIQPPMLGAALAAAQLLLSDELPRLQAELRERIQSCNALIEKAHLPLISTTQSPIRFIGMGLPRTAVHMVARLMQEGFFANASTFPAVPMKRAGLRFTLTRHHTPADLEAMVAAISRLLPEVLAAEGIDRAMLHRDFDLPAPPQRDLPTSLTQRVPAAHGLSLQHETTIQALERQEWNSLLGSRGSFDWAGLAFLEQTFQGNPDKVNNWKFHYYLVRDAQGKPVLATFFTEAYWKDDMLVSGEVSRLVEARRREDPYYLTSRNFAMGSLLTEGDHLWLDREADWKSAMLMLLEAASEQQRLLKGDALILRDLAVGDEEMERFLHAQGFMKQRTPLSHALEIRWSSEAEFKAGSSAGTRRHLKRYVTPFDDSYRVEVLGPGSRTPNDAEFAHYHRLYRNVIDQSFDLNTFALPETMFRRKLESGCWELVLLYANPGVELEPSPWPVAIFSSFLGAEQYAPMVIGLDYRYVLPHGLYRQCLRQMVLRAIALNKRWVYFSMDAEVEKRRFGAQPMPRHLFVQATDHYHAEVLRMLEHARTP